MEKKKVTKTAKQVNKTEAVKPKKATSVKAPQKVKVEPVVEVESAKVEVKKAEVVKQESSKVRVTLNQELNLVIGLLSIFTIVCFCFAFQGGNAEVLGWDLVLKAELYSGVFKWLMIFFVLAIFVDCILTIHIDTENEIFNIVEKILYVCTAVLNIIVLAVVLSLVSKIGDGLIIFMIISIISIVLKLARVYAKK